MTTSSSTKDSCPLCGERVIYRGLTNVVCEGDDCPNSDKTFSEWDDFINTLIKNGDITEEDRKQLEALGAKKVYRP